MTGKRKDRRFGEHFLDDHACVLSPGRRKRGRIRYLNWATEVHGELDQNLQRKTEQALPGGALGKEIEESINIEVRKAVEKLSVEERQFVELFYFESRGYREISRKLNKKIYKLERIHTRAVEKLRILLANLVERHFGLRPPPTAKCVICTSPHRQDLEQLIRNKKEEETYSNLIRLFKQRYGIQIKTPQTIIGHARRHMV